MMELADNRNSKFLALGRAGSNPAWDTD